MSIIYAEKNLPILGSNHRIMGTDVFFQKDKKQLPIVIYIHGFNGFKDWGNFDLIAQAFAEAGYFFIKMNLSHNGTRLEYPEEFVDLEAFGNNNITKELFDIRCIIDWVNSNDFPHLTVVNRERLHIIGHSKGGGLAVLKAAEDRRVKTLITWASISESKIPWGSMKKDVIEMWKKEGVIYYNNKRTNQQLPMYYQLYEDYLDNEEQFSIESAIKKLNIPILLCHGLKDEAVSINAMHSLKSWQPKAKTFVIDSDHVFGRNHPWTEEFIPEAMQQVVWASIDFLNREG